MSSSASRSEGPAAAAAGQTPADEELQRNKAPPGQTRQRRVHISYTHRDPDVWGFVFTLRERLFEAGFYRSVTNANVCSPFVTLHNVFSPSESERRAELRWMYEMAAGCDFFVPVITKRYATQPECMIELDLARDAAGLFNRQQDPIIIPVCYHSPELNMKSIKDYWRQDPDAHISRLLDLVHIIPEVRAQWQASLERGDLAERFASNMTYVTEPPYLQPGPSVDSDEVLAGEVITAIKSNHSTYTYTPTGSHKQYKMDIPKAQSKPLDADQEPLAPEAAEEPLVAEKEFKAVKEPLVAEQEPLAPEAAEEPLVAEKEFKAVKEPLVAEQEPLAPEAAEEPLVAEKELKAVEEPLVAEPLVAEQAVEEPLVAEQELLPLLEDAIDNELFVQLQFQDDTSLEEQHAVFAMLAEHGFFKLRTTEQGGVFATSNAIRSLYIGSAGDQQQQQQQQQQHQLSVGGSNAAAAASAGTTGGIDDPQSARSLGSGSAALPAVAATPPSSSSSSLGNCEVQTIRSADLTRDVPASGVTAEPCRWQQPTVALDIFAGGEWTGFNIEGSGQHGDVHAGFSVHTCVKASESVSSGREICLKIDDLFGELPRPSQDSAALAAQTGSNLAALANQTGSNPAALAAQTGSSPAALAAQTGSSPAALAAQTCSNRLGVLWVQLTVAAKEEGVPVKLKSQQEHSASGLTLQQFTEVPAEAFRQDYPKGPWYLEGAKVEGTASARPGVKGNLDFKKARPIAPGDAKDLKVVDLYEVDRHLLPQQGPSRTTGCVSFQLLRNIENTARCDREYDLDRVAMPTKDSLSIKGGLGAVPLPITLTVAMELAWAAELPVAKTKFSNVFKRAETFRAVRFIFTSSATAAVESTHNFGQC